MKHYFKKGFWMAIGWCLGSSVYKGVDRALDRIFTRESETYRNLKERMEE